MLKLVRCTREGRVGHVTATGHVIQKDSWFVALPATKALDRIIRLRRAGTEAFFTAPVLDVGPWNTHDEAYVFGSARPQAESGVDDTGRQTNGSGIDLSDLVFKSIGMPDNGMVEWEFV